MKIVADKHIPFLPGILEPYADVTYLPGSSIATSDLQNADALIVRTRTTCDAKLLSGSSIRYIASATTGSDHIDREFCQKNGIEWFAASGCNASSVVQYIAAALAELSKRDRFELHGKTLGIVGVGHVGRRVARYGRQLGMRVLQNDPPRAREEGSALFVPLDQLLEESDIITLHLPLTYGEEDRTFHLFDSTTFSKLKRKPIFINTARGEVVETEALKRAIQEKKISESVLDVWEHEPTIDSKLLSLVDIATPHIAGYSVDGKANGVAMVVQEISRRCDLPLHDWHPEKLPLPVKWELEIDAAGLSLEDVVRSAVLRTYDIQLDDRRLRKDPDRFEDQRVDYPLRREFPAYSVSIQNDRVGAESVLEAIGFQTKQA